MAVRVQEIMNPEVFAVRSHDSAKHIAREMLANEVSGAPVVDEHDKPLGVISLRDLITHRGVALAEDCMTAPALVIDSNAPITEAARLLAETGYHRLVVIHGDGRVAGVVTSTDVLRGLLGIPATHPSTFPHYDARTRRTWTDDLPLHLDRVEGAPSEAGVFLLIHGGAGVPDRVIWGESSENVRRRLIEILTKPSAAPPLLREWLARGSLRFRAARVADSAAQNEVLRAYIEELSPEMV